MRQYNDWSQAAPSKDHALEGTSNVQPAPGDVSVVRVIILAAGLGYGLGAL